MARESKQDMTYSPYSARFNMAVLDLERWDKILTDISTYGRLIRGRMGNLRFNLRAYHSSLYEIVVCLEPFMSDELADYLFAVLDQVESFIHGKRYNPGVFPVMEVQAMVKVQRTVNKVKQMAELGVPVSKRMSKEDMIRKGLGL